MVISTESPRQPPDPTAAAASPERIERQSQLHNFSFPILKKWGSQRVLRCLNVNRKGEIINSPPPISRSAPISPEKLLGALTPPKEPAPWNLRTRRSPAKDPSGSPVRDPAGSREERGGHVRTVRLRSEDAERRERARFSVALTREEIDEDIYAVTGSRARRRPSKRPRIIQKQLDMLFPGAWLSEITADAYKVAE